MDLDGDAIEKKSDGARLDDVPRAVFTRSSLHRLTTCSANN
jgi:hypothetical protein